MVQKSGELTLPWARSGCSVTQHTHTHTRTGTRHSHACTFLPASEGLEGNVHDCFPWGKKSKPLDTGQISMSPADDTSGCCRPLSPGRWGVGFGAGAGHAWLHERSWKALPPGGWAEPAHRGLLCGRNAAVGHHRPSHPRAGMPLSGPACPGLNHRAGFLVYKVHS